jgi:hypothetical protein
MAPESVIVSCTGIGLAELLPEPNQGFTFRFHFFFRP